MDFHIVKMYKDKEVITLIHVTTLVNCMHNRENLIYFIYDIPLYPV
jgi:hypothetical protein